MRWIICFLALPFTLQANEAEIYFSPGGFSIHHSEDEFNEVHPGVGLEAKLRIFENKKWAVGPFVQYMHRDSYERPGYFIGGNASYRLLERGNFYADADVGLMWVSKYLSETQRKRGVYPLPSVHVGYGPIGVKYTHIPAFEQGDTAVSYFGITWRVANFSY